jgi:hypothetical protein
MDVGWVIFAGGSASSFWPLYYVLNRIATRTPDLAHNATASPGDRLLSRLAQRRFLAQLRGEARLRLAAMIEDALAEREPNGGRTSEDPRPARDRLIEARSMVAALFAPTVVEALDDVLAGLSASEPLGAAELGQRIQRFNLALDAIDTRARSPLAGRRIRAGLQRYRHRTATLTPSFSRS